MKIRVRGLPSLMNDPSLEVEHKHGWAGDYTIYWKSRDDCEYVVNSDKFLGRTYKVKRIEKAVWNDEYTSYRIMDRYVSKWMVDYEIDDGCSVEVIE